MLGGDPLKIYYLLVLETDAPTEITPFQGFSISWPRLHWAIHCLTTLPADVLERSYKLDDVITQRMGGARPLMWILATLLPIGGLSSAGFIARLVYRIADFLPAALRAERRVLNWTEVVGGMIRMLLATEMLDQLVGPPEPKGTLRWKMQFAANADINSGEESWFDNLIENIAAHRGEQRQAVEHKAQGVMARSEAIRYVQLGSPETILIDDGRIRARVLKEYPGAPTPR